MPNQATARMPTADPRFTISEAKLSTISQALVYQNIQTTKKASVHAMTEYNLKLTKTAVRAHLIEWMHTDARI